MKTTVGIRRSKVTYRQRAFFRDFLVCSDLRYLTVKVGLAGEWIAEGDAGGNPSDHIFIAARDLTYLDTILTAAAGMYQKLKEKIVKGLRFETTYAHESSAYGEHIRLP